jgi:hypothetical protein
VIQQVDNATSNASMALEPHAESYYCSQLVAEIFMKLQVLHSNHRSAHEYIPADFSSATVIKALYGQKGRGREGRGGREGGRVEQTNVGTVSDSDHFVFSNDFVFDPKQSVLQTNNDNDKDKKTILSISIGDNKSEMTKAVSHQTTKTKNEKKEKRETEYQINLHVNDSLPSSVLKQLVAHTKDNQGERKGEIWLHGSVRILARGYVAGVVRSAHHHSPAFAFTPTISTSSERESEIPISDYLSYLGDLYGGIENLAIHAYNDTTTLRCVFPTSQEQQEQPVKGNEKATADVNLSHFDMMFVEECLRQAWLGFHSKCISHSIDQREFKDSLKTMVSYPSLAMVYLLFTERSLSLSLIGHFVISCQNPTRL